ncbi:MAG TPA: zf-HC2 domain-containing protein [Gaiellaceae bacterium]|nr:zf-HC2 domain-containing protein [Gaiellaceae bacterium]
MPRPAPSGRCDRARQWSSVRADGELSELEEALLEKHLLGCGACRAFDARLRSTTEMLRAAPEEAPSVRFRVPERVFARFPLGRRLAVAAIAVAAAAGSVVGSTLQGPATHPQKPAPQVSLLTNDLKQLRQLPRGERVQRVAPSERGGPSEGII